MTNNFTSKKIYFNHSLILSYDFLINSFGNSSSFFHLKLFLWRMRELRKGFEWFIGLEIEKSCAFCIVD